jgi:hypothetical protein
MMTNLNKLVRSAVTTFVTAFIALVPLSALASSDFSWLQSALIAAALTTVRTVVAYFDPGNTSFGLGSTVPAEDVALDVEQPDAPIEGE